MIPPISASAPASVVEYANRAPISTSTEVGFVLVQPAAPAHGRVLDPFAPFFAAVETAAKLSTDWDSYGAVSPNATAVHWARETLRILDSELLTPNRVDPSAEGGITIAFSAGDRYAHVECFNTGELVAALWRHDDNPEIWELSADAKDIEDATGKIRTFLGAGASAQNVSVRATGGSTIYRR